MFKKSLFIAGFFLMTSVAYSQVDVNNVVKEMQECKCGEIIMIAGTIEKKYTGSWLEGIEVKDGMIQFSKGNIMHKWNAGNIKFIENGGHFIRVYLN